MSRPRLPSEPWLSLWALQHLLWARLKETPMASHCQLSTFHMPCWEWRIMWTQEPAAQEPRKFEAFHHRTFLGLLTPRCRFILFVVVCLASLSLPRMQDRKQGKLLKLLCFQFLPLFIWVFILERVVRTIKSDLMPPSSSFFIFSGRSFLFPLPLSGNLPSVVSSPFLRRYSHSPSQREEVVSKGFYCATELGDFKKRTTSN